MHRNWEQSHITLNLFYIMEMENLYTKHAPTQCVEYVQFNGKIFKITIETGNYYYLNIYLQTKNGDFAHIANSNELKDFIMPHHKMNDEERMIINIKDIMIARDFIKQVFGNL